MKTWRSLAAVAAVAVLATACSGSDTPDAAADADGGAAVEGTVLMAGSSTVFPLAVGLNELFSAAQPDVTVEISSIGSGGGFERFCEEGATDISNASRAIKESEAAACAANGIEFLEVRVGTDALTMVTSTDTDYVECLTTEQVVQLFGPDRATTWDQVLDGAPADDIAIFAPDADSGTYDFMLEDVMGLEDSTQDYNASSDDNIIAQGVQSGTGTWGFFGFAYYQSNAESLKAIAHDGGAGCVLPSVATAQDGSYGLTRPLYIYVRTDALVEKPQVASFVEFFLDNVQDVVEIVGYVPAPQEEIDAAKAAVVAAEG